MMTSRGAGTLIAALLTGMKQRAQEEEASVQRRVELQKLAVKKVLAGIDFNLVSLHLAASQLTSGNSDVAYRRIQIRKQKRFEKYNILFLLLTFYFYDS